MRRKSVDGDRFFYCYLCGFDHKSEHEHTADVAVVGELIRRFPGEANRFTRLQTTGKLHFCCAWLRDDHGHRVRNVGDAWAERPPSRDQRPRSRRRAARVSQSPVTEFVGEKRKRIDADERGHSGDIFDDMEEANDGAFASVCARC